MIEEIRIRDLGVIEEACLELGTGLTVITGETGAGKTMLVTALGLLLGARADSGSVRTGSTMARVEGAVRLGDSSRGERITTRVRDAGGEVDGDLLLIGRQVRSGSRSRAFVGGAGAPLSLLTELADDLVALHGQSDQHRLLRTETQLAALDEFAGEEAHDLRQQFQRDFRRLRAVENELRQARESAREVVREAELLRLGIAEIDKVAPVAGEDIQLRVEEDRLAHADALRLAAETASGALSSDDGSDALGALGVARRALNTAREHDPQAAALAERATELSYLLSDLAGDVAAYSHGIDVDPLRLAGIAQRRAELQQLTRIYGETIDEVLAWASTSSMRLLELDRGESRIGDLERDIATLTLSVDALAQRLTTVRMSAARTLAATVIAEVRALAMPHARLEIAVTPLDALQESGGDGVEFLLSANAGLDPRPLNKGASGGELSRVMLGLEVSLAGTRSVPTFVFDEVDAGVGGRAAVEIGRRLSLLAESAQVLVVTHLPQVAAFADQHVVVRKSAAGAVTTSGVATLNEAERVTELSRMLAGQDESASAHAHARELLEMARGEWGDKD